MSANVHYNSIVAEKSRKKAKHRPKITRAAHHKKGGCTMPKEPATYRLNLELLNSKFPEKEIFTIKDIMLIGDMSRPTAQKEFPFDGKYISKVNLAYAMAQKGAPET